MSDKYTDSRADASQIELSGLIEPVRIITVNHVKSIAAAAFIFSAFTRLSRKCSLRVVQFFDLDALNELSLEQYNSFIFIDCNEKIFHEKFHEKQAVFISAESLYESICSSYPVCREYAYIIVAGSLAYAIEFDEEPSVQDSILRDSLQNKTLTALSADPLQQLNRKFIESLKLNFNPLFPRLADLSAMLAACSGMNYANHFIEALLGDNDAYQSALSLMGEYKNALDKALLWLHSSRKIIRSKGPIIINLEDYVPEFITSAVAMNFVRECHEPTFVLAMAYTSTDSIHLSLRSSTNKNIRDIAFQLFEGFEARYWADEKSAEGMIKRKDEERFISSAEKILGQFAVEENV